MVDLDPRRKRRTKQLEPIEVSDEDCDYWGQRYAVRYQGQYKLQSREENQYNAHFEQQWVDGELHLIGNTIGFEWMSSTPENLKLYRRPSQELILKVQEAQERENAIRGDRMYAEKLLKMNEGLLSNEQLCSDEDEYFG